ncbi:MAG TPA: hypothetical protein VNS31_00930 [Ramlibacter sp.]|nr:hypothetical protein [Ramlibacter sp.]
MDTRKPQVRRFARIAALAAALATGSAFAFCICHGTIIVTKFYDANANGVRDSNEPRIPGWPMTLSSANLAIDSTKNTDSAGHATWSVPPGTDYAVLEGIPLESNWVQSAPRDGAGNPVNPLTGIKVTGGYTTYVKFGNYCTKPSGGRTPGFWSNQNGQAKMFDEIDGPGEELALLSSLNLVDANGSAFDPATYGAFRTWLLNSTSTNMAYKLSSHLAAMALNIEAGFVNGNRFYVPFGGTVNELVALANDSLGDHPYTPTGSPDRAYQEQLKNYLDALNNGARVVPTTYTGCPRTFTPPY